MPQQHLFGQPSPVVVPAETSSEVQATAAALPASWHFGTSSWSFPGWRGLVYAREHTGAVLARDGLQAYARHPLLRTVGVDRSYYAPVPEQVYETWRGAVPDTFRFLVKATSELVRIPSHAQDPGPFLDVARAIDTFIGPATRGLADRAGPLLFQFSREDCSRLGGPLAWAERLERFLSDLPGGPLYAVEVRDPRWLTPRYVQALRRTRTLHCINIYPGMPTAIQQARILREIEPRALVVRWMLHPAWGYREAKETFAPFDRLVAPLPEARNDVVALLGAAERRGIPAWVIVNNKAEGSAPRSIEALAAACAARR